MHSIYSTIDAIQLCRTIAVMDDDLRVLESLVNLLAHSNNHHYGQAVGTVGGVYLESGAVGFFRKPVDGEALVELSGSAQSVSDLTCVQTRLNRTAAIVDSQRMVAKSALPGSFEGVRFLPWRKATTLRLRTRA